MRMAQFLYTVYQSGYRMHDYFIFCPALTHFGQWARQLMGESIGKKNSAGNPVGMVPTVSVGTQDLHSVGQLYAAVPHLISTTFISSAFRNTDDVTVYGDPTHRRK